MSKKTCHPERSEGPLSTPQPHPLKGFFAALRMTLFCVALTSCADLMMAIPKAPEPVVGELRPGVYQIINNGSKLDNWTNLYGDSVREAQNFCRPAGQTAHITAVDHHFEQRVRPLVVVTNFECVAASAN
jgi:hypothetical protein